jgi:amino acid adenylation domain-containing protein/non-ribosomal peptide synthase protein (TIGR01720 family)
MAAGLQPGPDRKLLFQRMLEERMKRAAPAASPLREAARPERLPLSFAQEGLWFLAQVEPESPQYNVPVAVRLSGELDEAALRDALSEVARRHESLRTVFRAPDGTPAQVVLPARPFTLPVHDFSPAPAGLREAELLRMAREEAERPFALEDEPPFRALLLCLGEDRRGTPNYALLLTVHHVASDGWSVGLLFRELSALYDAFRAGRPSPLPEPGVQYADYALWQRERLGGSALAGQLAYWKDALAGAPPVLELPTDHPRPAVRSGRGGRVRLRVGAEVGDAVRALARAEGATPFMVLLAAWSLLLGRYAGQREVVVGSPVAGRDRPELEGVIGYFTNTLALRADLSGAPTFRQLVGRVRATALGAYAHAELPFERLVQELQPERSLSVTPLFQAALALQNAPTGGAGLRLAGTRSSPVGAASTTAKFDLTLVLGEASDGGYAGALEYAADLFDEETARRMAGHFEALLSSAVARPEALAWELPWLGDEERRLLEEWSGGAGAYPADSTIGELFAAQAARRPHAVAVDADGERLTYGELEARSNRLANYLARRGVGPEARVGVLMERSAELIVVLLGILKAGAAYVPLDPAYPDERRAFMLRDSGARVVVTRGYAVDEMDGVCLERDADAIAAEPAEAPRVEVSPANAAYVIYTSGSTGKPKGVVIPHASVVRLFSATHEWFGFGEEDVWTLFHSLAFDFSVWETWGALLHGGRLVVVPFWVSRSPEAMHDLLVRERVTVLNQTPSAFRPLMEADAARPADALALRWVIFGGEALDPRSLRGWVERHGDEGPRLVNMYGITETTVHVTWRPLSREDVFGGSGSVIGGPIPDLRVYVLDASGAPAPIGVPGELYVGGAGAARGYLGRPGLTAERFVPDPFSGEPGARLYRSGDRARWLRGGELEYLGRLDQQVKVRGFRIELGEIESTLAAHPRIREVLVTTWERSPGDRQLVAYAVPAGDAPAAHELRAFLAERLPEHMVPAAFVLLPAFPLTPNGKLDRAALPHPDGARPELESAYRAPRNAVEEALAQLWAAVLGVERVGVEDSFFELGGDSILIIQVTARASQAGIRITPRQMFQHQTVAALAAAATFAPAAEDEQGPVEGPVPLTPIQRWFFAQDLPDPHHFNQVMLLEPREPLDAGVVEEAVARLLEHHDALRLRFERRDGGWRQWNAPPDSAVPFQTVDLSGLPDAERGAALEAAAAERQASLDLAAGPLVRAVLFQLGEGRQRLLVVAHHLVVDGVSWRVLVEDLETACRQLARGEPVRLPPKTASFSRWAQRAARDAASPEVRAELPFWIDEAGAPRPPLPRDGTGANTEGSARIVSRALDAEETRALLQDVPRAYHTRANDALLSALAEAFAEWTGHPSLLVEMEGHGRDEEDDAMDLSRTVGWFTSVYPVRLEAVDGGPGEQLKATKERLRRVRRGGTGYGLLRFGGADAEAARTLAALPAAEVSFNYLGQFDSTFSAETFFARSAEPVGAARNPAGLRTHLLAVTASVRGGRLRTSWSYSEHLHHRPTVERLADAYLAALRSLIAHVQSPDAGGYTPSDFPAAGISQRDLDALLRLVGG